MSITARVTNSTTVSAKVTPQDRVLVTNYRINASQLRLGDIFDVDTSAVSDGAHLVYSNTTQTWVATKNIDNVNTIISGGNF